VSRQPAGKVVLARKPSPQRLKSLREKQQVPPFSNNSNQSHASPLVIPTEAQRSGGICSAPYGSLKSLPASDPEEPSPRINPAPTAFAMSSCSNRLSNEINPTDLLLVRARKMLRFDADGWFFRVACGEGFERAAGRTADPSTSLRFGRDDKGRGVALVGVVSGMGRISSLTLPSKNLIWTALKFSRP
jgi:hypothetical protein